MPTPFRYAVCNEIFGKIPFAECCKQVKAIGYEGIEIAPFTLSDDPAEIPQNERQEIRSAMEGEGLCFAGLHWLLAAPPGLHLTTPDAGLREKSWDYLQRLIDLSADLSVCRHEYNSVVVLGSPKQRSTVGGMAPREAIDILTHGLAHAAPQAESRGIRILIEALSPDQTDVVTSLVQAVDIVKQIGSSAVQTMFDTHNAAGETDAHAELIRRFAPYIQHVHVNEMDGREPGMGDYDFASLLNALGNINYSGWVSLEAFDFTRDPNEIATRSLRHLQSEAGSSQTDASASDSAQSAVPQSSTRTERGRAFGQSA